MHRRASSITLVAAVLSILTACKPPAEESADRQKPNIVVILADDLGYHDIGAYGQDRVQTPRIDKMAQEGMRFTNFYAGSTVCAPSRSVLMTGQHTGRTYIRGNSEVKPMGQEPLPDSTVTLAEVMKGAGYKTGLVGKWGLGGPETAGIPNNQGFDYFFGYLCQRHAHNYYPEFLFRNSARVALPNVVDNDRLDGAGVAVKKVRYSPDLLMDESLRFIEENKSGPFLLMMTPTLPHANNEGGRNGVEVPDQGAYAGETWPENEKNFAAMVSLLDMGVGRILDKLQELGIAENTLVIFTSDNGPHREGGHDPDFFDSNGPLRGIKRDLYEGGIRVPMIAWWPGTIKQGQTSDLIAYGGDLFATAAEIAGAKAPANTQSISLVPTLLQSGVEQSTHPYLYWEFYENNPHQAVRMGKWKAVRTPIFSGEVELYDLTADEGEEHNVAADNPEVVKRMIANMEEAHRPSPIWNRE